MSLKIVRILKKLCDGVCSRIMHEGKLEKCFEMMTGARQGCVISQKWFIIFMYEIVCKVMDGVHESEENMQDPHVSDDIALLVDVIEILTALVLKIE